MTRTLWITAACWLVVAGCAPRPELPVSYGRATGDAVTSVNGTSVLAEMFRQTGRRVHVSRRLGGLVAKADVVVWAPDTYELPQREVTRYFDQWLADQPGRILVYVVKGYDGATEYWSRVAKQDPASLDVQRRLARAKATADRVLAELPEEESCDWFRVQRTSDEWQAPIAGPWSPALPSAKAGLRSTARLLAAHPEATQLADEDNLESESMLPLLQADDNVLAAEYRRSYWGGGRVLLMSSGSWLFNLPLVEPDNRRLAQSLVDECGQAQRVVFLESGETGPRISAGKHRHHALEAFTIRPFNSILLHLTVLGMVFCFSMFPIFGRPHPMEETVRSDFRRHVAALGELIAKTGDVEYARQRRDYYWRKVRRDSGKTHMQELEQLDELTVTALPPPAEPGNPFAPETPAGDPPSEVGKNT